ncbi:unnamed protein product [Hymenolepis diminuta]|uniref:PHB domain-containing protein n=1 Tax=Hymenolepis diminuta TaxID=6216 RepID=A0A158QEG6_HYMDI|nr:unnamed protein product [Hymenolepis diminuta]
MVVENLDGHREKKFGMHRVKPKDNNVDSEEVLIPFTVKSYTFSYEAAGLKSPDKNNQHTSVNSPKPAPAFEFGTAFEFSQDYPFDDQKTSKVKKKKKKSVPDDDIAAEDEEVPTHYQSIFTYESAFLDDPKFSDFHEEEPTPLVSRGTYIFLVLLSALFLILTFPISTLFCIKRLPKSKKLIIFRLGKVLKPRGPGCILILPFVDECHIVDLAEQSLAVKPLTATTSDTGEVEVGCQVVFHIVEPEAAVTYWSRNPHDFISKKAETALVAAVARIQWDDIISGHGSPDIASDVRSSLNAYCSPIGIQILEVKLTAAKCIKDPPKLSDQVHSIDFQKLGKQIASLSPLLMGGVGDGLVSATQRASAQFTSLINQIAGMKSQTASITTPLDPLTTSASEVVAKVSKIEVDQLVERALARSQIFLNNERARAALGSASLQVFVYSSDIHQENECMVAFYMDSDTVGILETKNPSATVHIGAAHLAETLEGRLDLLEAMKMTQIRFSGSLLALSKLRYLLQFK